MRRRRPSVLITGTAAALIGVSVAASSPQVNSGSADAGPQRLTLLAADPAAIPDAPAMAPLPQAPPDVVAGLDARAQQAASDAAQKGADIGFTLLDRETGRIISDGDGGAFPIASVSKLFIADDLLMQVANGQRQLTPEERQGLDAMLRSSDDSSAEVFWSEGGGSDIISRVSARYGLTGTSAPYDGHWWNTMSTTADLVRYYDMLLDGAGGLPPQMASMILSDLSASTPIARDGYPQRFGIPDGLFAEPVAVKQGWMPGWNGDNWLHMSTGVIGPTRRFVIAIGSMQPVDDTTARDTVTQAIKTMFPGGRI
ncbi:class A beta-lactamase-related serine hydrolase [Candidatus Mycolicibacterium alkanivorans]|uniref:Class A beta-lactamase-related serine hydrolase n=1 Tax=Candidatus Mycolicibacterium alkanivorans TaxID=2954114 RepID=A0ABS9Z0H7_9MYCO|nr:class A beta-lactamase-related serine hydrolase [Candidatus Mycolicibacterium alkanivorans]MCI4676534.1 class A beta-lactamase-related serine hydrolase [Candidatus Mycolicibacterium alkanivorans]